MFTNVDNTKTIRCIKKRLKENDNWKSETKLDVKDIIYLLKLATDYNYFYHDGHHHRQNNGTPIGSPISPIFADFFVQLFENATLPRNKSIKSCIRYVDDIYAIIKKTKKLLFYQPLTSLQNH
jgi:retron-type reverse transcriptase